MAQGKFGGGTGLITDPYLVEDIADLNQIRVNPSLHYKLKYSINAGVSPYNEGNGWNPIENFTGTLDGNGKKIFNLFINRPNEDDVGLFRQISFFNSTSYPPNDYNSNLVSATIRNMFRDVGLENVNITGRNNVGALIGGINFRYNTPGTTYSFGGLVKRVFITGKVKGSSAVGGLIGSLHASFVYNYGYTSNEYNMFINNWLYDVYTNCEITATSANVNYSGMVGRLRLPSESNPGYNSSLRLHTFINLGTNLVTNSTFSSSINGLVAHPIIAVNDGKSPTSITNAFYNSTNWVNGTNDGVTALTTEEMKRSTYLGSIVERVNDFDQSQRTWTFERGRYPQLYFSIANNLFIQTTDGFYSLDSSNKLVKRFEMMPTREEALQYGFKDISKVSNDIWKELREKYAYVDLVNIVERASNVSNKMSIHDLESDATNSTDNRLVYRKQFSFDDFNDGIATIRTV